MSDNKYPNSGVLWVNRKKTEERHPDMTGTIEIDRALLQELINLAKDKKDLKIDVSAWKKKTKAGDGFLSLKVKKGWEKEGGSYGGGGSYSGGGGGGGRNTSRHDDDDIPF